MTEMEEKRKQQDSFRGNYKTRIHYFLRRNENMQEGGN
jgi:hypothetical protein